MAKRMKTLTPLKAIRANCLDCSGGSPAEVRLCVIPDCPLYCYQQLTLLRFIPACTGNSSSCCFPFCFDPVHPPRVRGTPPGDHQAAAKAWFIPACTGNSIFSVSSLPPVHPRVYGNSRILQNSTTYYATVHPRVYGELRRRGKTPERFLGGSSPRLRGTPISHSQTKVTPVPA